MSAERENQAQASSALHAAARLLSRHDGPIVILTHENPDGDAIGSVLGLSRALRQIGKQTMPVAKVPRFLQFLPSESELLSTLPVWPEHALLVVVDVDNNDAARVAGADVSAFAGPVLNLDHHGTNQRRATVSVVEPGVPATTILIHDLVMELGLPLNEETATPLMLGLITDTGSFRFDSVTPDAFRCAAELRRAGARLGWLNDQLAQNPASYYLLLREVLGSLEFLHDGQVVLAQVNEAMLARAGASWETVDSYVGLLRNAEGSRLAVILKDLGDRVKVSLRSRGGLSAQNIAVALGGGGHVPAAGVTLTGSLEEVRPQLEAAIAAELSRAQDSLD